MRYLKNVRKKDGELFFYHNGVVKQRLLEFDIKTIEIVRRRKRRWVVEFIISLSLVVFSIRVIFWIVKNLEGDLASPKGYRVIATGITMCVVFFFLGVNGFKSISVNNYLLVNNKILVKIEESELEQARSLQQRYSSN